MNSIGIDDRPCVVDKRTRIGGRKFCNRIGKNRQGASKTIVERKTRFTFIGRLLGCRKLLLINELLAVLFPYKGKVFMIAAEDG